MGGHPYFTGASLGLFVQRLWEDETEVVHPVAALDEIGRLLQVDLSVLLSGTPACISLLFQGSEKEKALENQGFSPIGGGAGGI